MKNVILAILCLSSFMVTGLLYAAHPALLPDYSYTSGLYTPERADSAHGFDITKYEITLTVNDQSHFINGSVKAHVTAEETLTGIDYNLIDLTVSQVLFNNTITTFTHQNGILHVNLSAVPMQEFTTEVFYSGTPQHSPAPYNLGIIFGNNTVFTLSDPDACRYWWPCYDHPWDKAVVDLHITMRDDWLVACNGLRESIVDNNNGTKTHNWIGSNPMAPYLACFTAGPYVEINQTSGTLPIMNFVQQSQYNNAVTDFSTLPEIIQFYENQYGAYPFEKYGNAVVNMTTYGAMEHQTMTTLGYQFITGNHSGELTIAHELAHSWFGNCLTPLTFKDVWLSEGFATYSEALWMHERDGWQAACNYINNSFHQYYINFENANSGLPNIIYDPPFNNYFYPQSYEKAASVLHMLRLKIGNANFFQLLQNWFATYHNGYVITAEFQAMAETISGQDLDQFFAQWIYRAGIPSVEYTVFSSEAFGRLKIIAKTISPNATQFHLEIPVSLAASPADSMVIKASPEGYVNDTAFNINLDLSTLTWDPRHWILARQHTARQLQLTQCLGSNGLVILTWSALSDYIPIAGYNIWRKQSVQTDWILINDNPVNALTYEDTDVNNGTQYQYRITAVDNGGYESLPSNVMTSTPLAFAFDWGMLVVDETRDGTGTTLSPTDAMVDDFYTSALTPLSFTMWDYAAMGAPSLSVLSHYPIVLWHSDDFSQIQVASNLDVLGSYLFGSGKLVLSGWKTASTFSASFTSTFLPDVNLVFDNNAVLVSAQSTEYPQLLPDPDKLSAIWNGMIPMVYTFQGAGNALYTAQMTTDASGNGLPAAARFEDHGNLVLFGFPLFYMQPAGVRGLLQQLLPELYPALPNDDNTLEPAQLTLSCYPNPFTGKLNISLNQKLNPLSTLKIYNIKGQLINAVESKSIKTTEQTMEWRALDKANNPLPAGVYLIRYEDSTNVLTKKVILLN